jgi:hypothetical protein
MERLKLGLDFLAGVIIPIIVALIPLVWSARVADRAWLYIQRLFIPGLLVIAVTTLGTIGYGLAIGFYSPRVPNPLTALTDNQRTWFAHFLEQNNNPSVSLEKFLFNGIKRFAFVRGKDFYEIQTYRGSIRGFDQHQTPYDFHVTQLTESGKHKVEFRFFDADSGRLVEPRNVATIPLSGTPNGFFFWKVLSLDRRDFNYIQVSTYEYTIAWPGSLDTIAVPLQRYTGDFGSFEYVIIFDTSLEKSGLYEVTQRSEQFLDLFRGVKTIQLYESKVKLDAIYDDRIDSQVQSALKILPSSADFNALVDVIKKTTWREAYTFSIPPKTNQPLAFQFIKKDE